VGLRVGARKDDSVVLGLAALEAGAAGLGEIRLGLVVDVGDRDGLRSTLPLPFIEFPIRLPGET
jgi:hypothetical protein